jgi:retron-type reverse transcriptase
MVMNKEELSKLPVSTKRQRIATIAKQHNEEPLTLLHHYIDEDWLKVAYYSLRKDSAPGIDRQTWEEYGGNLDENVRSLLHRAKSGRYKAPAVRRAEIPKPGSKEKRKLGIPTIEDKVLQKAVLMILEPNELFNKRVRDGVLTRLIGKWLKAGVLEDGSISYSDEGTPQGGIISPLLANIFLHRFDELFHREPDSPYQFANARLVRYADDFVVQARYLGRRIITWIESHLEQHLQLTINREKTGVVKLREPRTYLNFLGFTLRFDQDLHGRSMKYLNTFPSKTATMQLKEKIRDKTRSSYKKSLTEVIKETNEITRGWKNYFNIGYPRKEFRALNHFTRRRFQRFLRNRSQRRSRPLRDGESLYAGLKRRGLAAPTY